MDDGVLQRILGIDRDRMARMGRVRRWNLEAITALRTPNKHGLASAEPLDMLEEMDPPERNPLLEVASGKREHEPGRAKVGQGLTGLFLSDRSLLRFVWTSRRILEYFSRVRRGKRDQPTDAARREPSSLQVAILCSS